MNVIDWVVQNGLVDVSCDLFSHTIPLTKIDRMSREKPDDRFQSGCVINLIVAGQAIQFTFESQAHAATFRADVRAGLTVRG